MLTVKSSLYICFTICTLVMNNVLNISYHYNHVHYIDGTIIIHLPNQLTAAKNTHIFGLAHHSGCSVTKINDVYQLSSTELQRSAKVKGAHKTTLQFYISRLNRNVYQRRLHVNRFINAEITATFTSINVKGVF